MYALKATRRNPVVAVDYREVKFLSGYDDGRKTHVVCHDGRHLYLNMPVEEARAALHAERTLAEGLTRLQRERVAFEAEHPEFEPVFRAMKRYVDPGVRRDAL